MQLMQKTLIGHSSSGRRNLNEFFSNCRRIADTAIVYRGTAKRRQICFHEQRAHPKIIRQQASTLQTRKIWQAYCRLKEILVAVPGIRRERTIKKLGTGQTVAT